MMPEVDRLVTGQINEAQRICGTGAQPIPFFAERDQLKCGQGRRR